MTGLAAWARSGASSASRSSIRRRATATACAAAGDSPVSSPVRSRARAAAAFSRCAMAGAPWRNRVAWMRCDHAVCSPARSRYSCSSTRSSITCCGGIHDSGARPSAARVRKWRAPARSVLARFSGPRRSAAPAGPASSAVTPARCSSSTTNRQPVQPSTANVTSSRPANRASHSRSVWRHAGSILPRRACPATVSRQSKVTCRQWMSNPPTIATTGTSSRSRTSLTHLACAELRGSRIHVIFQPQSR